jgi:ATP/maltotriose-dependent transcriptional regulator MalT
MADVDGSDALSLGGVRLLPRHRVGFDALRTADWPRALSYFEDALEAGETPEALEGLGIAACHLGDEPATFKARERAYELYRARGELTSAARLARALTVDCIVFKGAIALANGWLGRVHSLLEGLPESAEHGWLQLIEAQKALLAENDCASAEAHALEALRIGEKFGDADLEAEAQAVLGVAMVTSGRVQDGLGRLDEAGTACLTGEVKAPWIISSVLCYVMDACDRARDWDRAREWFAHIEKIAEKWQDRVLHAQCRPHYAVVLTWRGSWEEAERELQQSIDELSVSYKPMAVEGIVRLAELRWRQGRLEDAATLFEQVKNEPLAQLGQAVLALEHNDPAAALELVERCLRRLPPQDRLERLPALELHIRACLLQGNCEGAREVLPELQEIMGAAPSKPLRASARLVLGLIAVAEERLDDARMYLEDAVDLYEECGAPFEAGRARLDLAGALAALGRRQDASSLAEMAFAAFERLGATGEARRAREMLDSLSGTPVPAAGDSLHGLTVREVEVLRLLAMGLSNQEIADRLVLSIRTVQRHVENIYAKTGARGRAAAAVFATTHSLTLSS